jgi:GNAT superfamily N-acetyltransferase
MPVQIQQAVIDDLDDLANLFDLYRQFYGQAPDIDRAKNFLRDRFYHSESIIFIARDDSQKSLGFTQLFPSFTSTGCARIYILNDLFVIPGQRAQRVGTGLLDAAAAFGRKMGAVRLTLSTAVDNAVAQRVYEGAGWTESNAFKTYNLAL